MARPLPALLAVSALALVLATCGSEDDKGEIERTVRDFVNATNDRDGDTFCSEIVTHEFLEQSTGAKGDEAEEECKRQLESIKGLDVKLVEITKTEVDDDTATVHAVIETQGDARPQTLRLQKEDGKWKLTGGS